MHHHHQHQHSPSCLTIWPAFHPRAVPERICRGCVLHGGEGCKAGMATLRGDSTLTQELVTLLVDISLERIFQVASSHPFLSLIGLAYSQPLTVPLPSSVLCFCTGMWYPWCCLVQGINNLFSFFCPRLFLPQTGSAVQFTVQLHKQLYWCNRRAATRWGTSGQGQWRPKPTSLPKELITKLHP